MKKILFYALGVLLPVAVCLAVYSYEKPITDPTAMANMEALCYTVEFPDGSSGECLEPWTNICVKVGEVELKGVFHKKF